MGQALPSTSSSECIEEYEDDQRAGGKTLREDGSGGVLFPDGFVEREAMPDIITLDINMASSKREYSGYSSHHESSCNLQEDPTAGVHWMVGNYDTCSTTTPTKVGAHNEPASMPGGYQGTIEEVHLVIKLPSKLAKLDMTKQDWVRQATKNVLDVRAFSLPIIEIVEYNSE
jgi:hypothetical protein